MDITISNYHKDITEKELKTFLYSGKIGIHNVEKDIKTLPSFNRVVTSDKYIFVEANGYWGVLDKDLRLIAPPIYKEIFPVNRVDRDRFISSCQSNHDAVSVTLSSNKCIPTHIAIQPREINTDKIYEKYGEGLMPSFYNKNIDEEDKACFYEVNNCLENVKTDLFVTISDDDTQLVNISELEIKQSTGFRGYEFYLLWHYKDNMFIIRNNNFTFVTSTFKDGRFTKKSLWGEYDDSFEEYGSPQVVLHRGEFISVRYPETYRFVGSPFLNKEKEKKFDKKRGRWALFKYHHTKIEEDDKGWYKLFSNENTCFEQLTSFVFEDYATQLQNDNEFICHGDDRDFFMRFEQIVTERSKLLKIYERYETMQCSQGKLNIIACYDSIEQREDGLFDISTADGYGLYDTNMQVIIPPIYDNVIGDIKPLMIVSKGNRYGLVNSQFKEIVPCQYDYIQIGKGHLNIWDWDCEWDNMLVDTVDKCSINHKVEIIPSDDDLTKEGYIIIGVTLEKSKLSEQIANPTTLIDKLKNLKTRTQSPEVLATHCDIYLPNGKFVTECTVGKLAEINYHIEEGLLVVSDSRSSLNSIRKYGVFVNKSSVSVISSNELSEGIHSISGNSSEGYYDLEEIIITKDINKVEWNGLGRWKFRKFNVAPENKVFCEVDGVLYTQKGYDRNGCTDRKQMIELVACPTNVRSHDVIHGTKRIANCAFKGSLIEKLILSDTLEEIGVNAFYMTPNLKHLKLPLSIRKIESQDVGMSGDASPSIEYDEHSFANWEALYEYMLRNGFEKKNGNIVAVD